MMKSKNWLQNLIFMLDYHHVIHTHACNYSKLIIINDYKYFKIFPFKLNKMDTHTKKQQFQ